MIPNRIRVLNKREERFGPIIYWMQRDQRADDNWALIFAAELAKSKNVPLIVVFNLINEFLEAGIRQYDFMLRGLEEVEESLQKKNIPFYLTTGDPSEKISEFIDEIKAGVLVSDFNPLNIVKKWKKEIVKKIDIRFYEVDAHNIIPCWIASPKQEFAAYSFRPKINKALDEYLDQFPKTPKMKHHSVKTNDIDWERVRKNLKVNFEVKPVDWITPGEKAAKNKLKYFLDQKLKYYNALRNDPVKDAQSGLSPYLHFGQISAQRIALETQPFIEHKESQQAFLEELIVRRELSDNFCFYNDNYDNPKGFPDWAKGSLAKHKNDEREIVYTFDEFEFAKTHDELWNAAQIQMMKTGKMHGYMRMYWAKKILEWTNTPQYAMKIAIYLNDKYELDGRDPNGYAGVAWSIGGVHDRAFGERPVFGKVRFMSYNGAKRKFDIGKYIDKYLNSDNQTEMNFEK